MTAVAFPYSRYACTCSEEGAPPASLSSKRSSRDGENEHDQDETFNSHAPRANYSLYPIEHLLFCDDCNEGRCQKCWGEEMMMYYCPKCMFEVPTSGVKADGNRCSRNCYECPACSAYLEVTLLRSKTDNHLKPDGSSSSSDGTYFLLCQYCEWSTLDIGITFSRPSKITEQLNRYWKARTASGPSDEEVALGKKKEQEQGHLHHDAAFANLSKFYKEQLNESSDQTNPYSNSPYSSPANLARIMSLYGGLSYNALKKSREKPQPMREAGNRVEGLSTFTPGPDDVDNEVIRRMQEVGLEGMTTEEQRLTSPFNYEARFTDQLWPVATKLRVRRGKRCRNCRQFLTRPENKATDKLRYKIRLLASNYVPQLTPRPLQATGPALNPSFRLRNEPLKEIKLQAHVTQQYVLTIRNPIFAPVKVSLATPATTPGKVASKVTILCPSFEVGKAGDEWEEALADSTIGVTSDGGRKAAMASLTGQADAERQPEAGKIWEKTRHTTSVILEVVPGGLNKRRPSIVPVAEQEPEEELEEDEDILEIPIYVRVEWEAEATGHEGLHHGEKGGRGDRINKELAYWCVLGLGRIVEG